MRSTKRTMKIAFCGVIAALSIVLMMLTGILPIATIAVPAMAGCFLIAVVVEADVKWAMVTYAVVSVLSFILVPDREAALLYILLFGYYPVLFSALGKIKNKVLRYVAKLAILNAAILLELWLSVNVFGIPMEEMGSLGKYSVLIVVLLFNVVFVIYDYALNGLILMYIAKLHDKVRKMFGN